MAYISAYLKAAHLSCDYTSAQAKVPAFSEVVELDLSAVVPCLSGPKRPQDRVELSRMKTDFENVLPFALTGMAKLLTLVPQCLKGKVGFKGFGIAPERLAASATVKLDNATVTLKHGSVVIAAITSCTNTSNPSVMLGAGLYVPAIVPLAEAGF